jgi:hypothetical protein
MSENNITELYKIIDKNNYVINKKSTKNKDINYLSYLLENEISQSDCIKLGNAIEYVLNDIILLYNTNLVSIKEKNCKGEKEKDHLYKDENQKIIYYA